MYLIKKKWAEFQKLGLKDFANEYQISLIILAIFGIAFALRIYGIANIPGGFSENELSTVEAIKRLNLNNFWPEGGFNNTAYIYLGYLWTKIFGLTVINLRILSALLGGITVVLSYIFIAKWFSRKVAIFTAMLFAISSFHITVSRLIVPEVILPALLLGIFVCLTYAYRTKNIWLFGVSGLLIGLGFYTSPAFILVPLLFTLSGAYFFKKNKKFFTSYKLEIIAAATGLVSILIPYLVSFVTDPYIYLDVYTWPGSLTDLLINISQVPYILFISAPANFFTNVGTEPLVDPLIYVTAIGGFFFALLSIARRKYFFLIFWLLTFFFYAAFQSQINILGLLSILPVLYAFSALILDYILDRWLETFPYNKKARLFAVGLISIFFALSTLYNFNRYFVAYQNAEEVKIEFSFPAPISLTNK